MSIIIGKVIDVLTRKPIAEASVLLNNTQSFSTDIAQLTNDNGEFKWQGLKKGVYSILVIVEGYKSKNIRVTCNGNGSIKIVVSLLNI